MSEIVVVAEIGIQPEKRAEALAALEELCAQTHAQDPGCLLYALHLDPADEGHVFMIEKWESPEALQAHGATDHIKGFAGTGVLSGPPQVTVLNPAGYGDAEKGTV